MKYFLILSSFYGLTTVILGAFGAHALKERLDPQQLLSWDTGVRYQMIHALGMLLMVLLIDKGLALKPTLWFFSIGTALFSGSIYLLCLGWGPSKILGPITPLGGLSLILGWAWLLIAIIKSPNV